MTVQPFNTSGGASIYQIPLEVFPGFWGCAYLALVDGYRVLIDTGSGFGDSNQHLEGGLQGAGAQAVSSGLAVPQPFSFADLTHILITHGHIDHFGGLAYIRSRSRAQVGVHELDRRILTRYEERVVVVARRLGDFLVEAGVPLDDRSRLLDMYRMNKALFSSVSVDFTYEAGGMRLGPFEFLHVPGHCAGHVVIRLHDVLFTGDHVLHDTSPHQAPERLTLSTGLDHYLSSLNLLKPWAVEARLALGGHEEPITDLPERIDAVYKLHLDRLEKVLGLLAEPGTVSDVAHGLFGKPRGYHELLALEEAGAHVEYLYQRGLLEIANLDEVDACDGPVSTRYRRVY